ncbi:MAG: HAD-IIB family hydrolase [Microcystaceae cyanobacterium]
MNLLIFTDLDGTLLNPDDYRYDAALPLLEDLKQRHIPVIPVTSKTRVEVETLLNDLRVIDPFIVENGSGIFVPLQHKTFIIPQPNPWQDYHLQLLGVSYEKARQTLSILSKQIGQTLIGFGDLSVEDIQEKTGLSFEDAQKAKNREFTEPFLTPNVNPTQLKALAADLGYKIVIGDRFSHLISAQAGKGKAVQWLQKHYQWPNPTGNKVTIGLGNSPNDLEMLETVDIPVIIPGHKGVHSGLEGKPWQVADAVGCQGWVQAVTSILNNL